MTIEEIRNRLAEMPGQRTNPLPLVKSGARVSVQAGDLAANGTVRFSYGTDGNAIARVRLDGTGDEVEVSWDRLHPEREE